MGHLFQDPTFWVAVSFVLFLALIYWKARDAIREAIDGRIDRIRSEIENAENLREQAQAALVEVQRKQREASRQAEDIVSNAKSEVDMMKAEAQKKLEESLARREALAKDKIAQAEANAIKEVQNLAVNLAANATEQILREKLAGRDGDKIVDQAIEDLPNKLH